MAGRDLAREVTPAEEVSLTGSVPLVIGIDTGREDNLFWRRVPGDPTRVEAAGARALSVKETLPMGDQIILQSGVVEPVECLHYAMSLPTSVVITGIESRERLDQALEAARTFRPMTPAELAALRARTRLAAADGSHPGVPSSHWLSVSCSMWVPS